MKKYFEKRNKFICPWCGYEIEFKSFWEWLLRPHLFDIWRYVECPKCKLKGWARRIKK